MRYEGIVIKKIDRAEYDQLAFMYTSDFGKMRGIVKSIAKPTSKQAPHVDILNQIGFSLVSGNGYPIVTSAISINNFSNLKKSLPALSISMFLTEVIDKLVYDNDPDPRLWDFFVKTLEYLNNVAVKKSTNFENTFSLIQKRVLMLLGYIQSDKEISNKSLDYLFQEHSQNEFNSLQLVRSVLK